MEIIVTKNKIIAPMEFSFLHIVFSLIIFFALLLSYSNAHAIAFTVSTSAPAGEGSFSPTDRIVNEGDSTFFNISAESGYTIATVTGCGGNWTGNPYYTGPISGPCTVVASFDAIPSSFLVSTSAPPGQGTLSPTSSLVNTGSTTSFTVTASTDYVINNVTGCGGTWTGINPYHTGVINNTCTVTATFTPVFEVTTSAPAGQGYFSPLSRTVNSGDTATFTVTAEAGYSIDTITGCSGIWTGNNPYTTAAISMPCTVTASFNPDFIVTPSPGPRSTLLAASGSNGLALKADGTMIQWGHDTFGSLNMPSGLTNMIAVAAPSSAYHSLALKDDGTVVTWGNQVPGILSVPAGLVDVIAVSAGDNTGGYGASLVLKKDGTVAAWGNGQIVSALPANLTSVVVIAAARGFGLAVKSDGTVVQWGVVSGLTAVPEGLSDVISVAGGTGHALALKSNGTVVAWGQNNLGQATVPAAASTGVIAISAGSFHSLALKDDGTVVAWGNNSQGQAVPPAGLTGVVAISAGNHSGLALKSDGSLVHWGYNSGSHLIPASLNLLPFHGARGTISPNMPQGDISNGSTLQFTLFPDTGYTASVNGSCGGTLIGNNFTTNAISVDCSVEAIFTTSHTVTASVSGGNGSIDPLSTMIADGSTASFTATADSGYGHDNTVGGTCTAGTWNGNVYTTGAVNGACSVDFSFILNTYLVSASSDAGGGVLPASRTIDSGTTADFTVTPYLGFITDSAVDGNCPAGTWSGSTYTTGAITGACIVSFTHTVNTPGDVNGDQVVGLEDAIIALKIITGETATQPITKGGDVNNNQKIGMEEVMYILKNN